jgi:hypothetical protein
MELPLSVGPDTKVLSSPVRTKKRNAEEVQDTDEDWDLESIDNYEWEDDEVQIIGEKTVHETGPPGAKRQRVVSSEADLLEIHDDSLPTQS